MKLSAFLDHFDEVKFEGNGWAVTCPAHDDSHASLRVAISGETDNLLLKCRAGCLTGAVVDSVDWLTWPDLFDVDVDVEGWGKYKVGNDAGPVDATTQARMAAYLSAAASAPVPQVALDYASRRFGLDAGMFASLGLGFDSGGDYDYDFLGRAYTDVPRLVVPFRDADGIPRGFQARDISEAQSAKAKWSGPSNPAEGGSWSRTAFMESGSGIDFVVISEGPGDALTSVAAGVDAVGIRGVSHAKAVVEELSVALRGRRVVLAGDNDRAGQGMNTKLGDALTEAGLDVYVLELPDHVGDISDWFESDPVGFAGVYQAAVTSALPYQAEEPSDSGPGVEIATDDLKTHVGVAREVVSRFDGLLYANGLGFFVYANGVWVKDRMQMVRSTIHGISDQLAELAQEMAGQEAAKTYAAASARLRSTTFIDYVIKELKAMVPVDPEDFDQEHHLLGFLNCVVDLKSGEMLEHSKDFMLTRQIAVEYDPDAVCPRWDQFIEEIMPDQPEMPSYLQRLVGYGITGSTAEQCFAVLWGTGANGKSIFTDTLSEVFQDVTTTTPFSTFEERANGGIPNDLAALRGARLVFASEGERGKPMAESVIKRVTGQDMITARFMREEFFSFRPTFLIMMGTNYKPNFKGQDEGLWRRVKLVPFKRFFAEHERDHYLGQKLRAEAEGIVAWAVRGSIEWYRSGLGDPASVVNATRNYRETADALSGYFPDGPLVRGEATDFVVGSDAYKLYEQWCDDEALPMKERWSRRAFYGAMEERGLEKMKREQGICLFGAKLAAESVPEPVIEIESNDKATIFGGAR